MELQTSARINQLARMFAQRQSYSCTCYYLLHELALWQSHGVPWSMYVGRTYVRCSVCVCVCMVPWIEVPSHLYGHAYYTDVSRYNRHVHTGCKEKKWRFSSPEMCRLSKLSNLKGASVLYMLHSMFQMKHRMKRVNLSTLDKKRSCFFATTRKRQLEVSNK